MISFHAQSKDGGESESEDEREKLGEIEELLMQHDPKFQRYLNYLNFLFYVRAPTGLKNNHVVDIKNHQFFSFIHKISSKVSILSSNSWHLKRNDILSEKKSETTEYRKNGAILIV